MTDHLSAAQSIARECFVFRVRRASRVITQLYDEALRPLGLHANQLTLLCAVALMERRDEHGAPMSELAEVLAMDLTTLSRNLRPLQKSRRVEIERSPLDRRVRLARLTTTGRHLVANALPLWKHAHALVAGALGPRAAGELKALLDAAASTVPASSRAALAAR